MRLHYVIGIGLAVLGAIFASGCSKRTEQEARLRKELSIAIDMPLKNLGVVELSADRPKQVHLGPGKTCTITATLLTNNILQMNLAYQSAKDSVDWRMARRHSDYSETQRFLLHLGQQCAVTLENVAVVLRPSLVAP